MTTRRLDASGSAARVSTEVDPLRLTAHGRSIECVSIRCTHPTARCTRCRAPDCVHALDAGVCAPCQVRGRSSERVEDLGPGLVAWSFGGGLVEFIEDIGEGPKAPQRRQWRGR